MTKTTTGEGDNLIASSSTLKEMIEEHFVCGTCAKEDDMAIVDAIVERSKSLVSKYMHKAIDDAVVDEQNKHMMKKK
eukprot:6809192-Ditylum_brightwellii.AAC.1